MKIFLCVANNLRIIKAFIFEPLANGFISTWNQKYPGDQCHLEVYKVDQEFNFLEI